LRDRLTSAALGNLSALYEHRVCAQTAIWHSSAFEQRGVELGKVLARRMVLEQSGAEPQLVHES
jgi:glucose-6-phosphate isomerase